MTYDASVFVILGAFGKISGCATNISSRHEREHTDCGRLLSQLLSLVFLKVQTFF